MANLTNPNIIFKLSMIGASKTGNRFNMKPMSFHSSGLLKKGNTQPNPEDPADKNYVLVENVKNNGIITLNRPEAMNTLNLSMMHKIYEALQQWDGSKKLVIMKGAGQKAFCAGADVKDVSTGLEISRKIGMEIPRIAYKLANLIGTYKTPYVAVMNGITMGGGAGLSVNGRYRIATENSLFAMPETAIGTVPDVGGTFFLPRLKGKLGYYLGLTGHRLKGTDVLMAGLATHYVPSERLGDLINELLELNSGDIDDTMKKYQPDNFNPEFTLNPYLEQIDYCFSAPTMEEVVHRLELDGSDWAVKTLKVLHKMSPTALVFTLQAMKNGSQQSLVECLSMEFRLVFSNSNMDSDFHEGVRALLINKDQKPKWKPARLSEVSREDIEARFAKLPDEEELKLQ